MPTNVVNVKEIKWAGPRKANECLAEAKRFKPQAELFDEFWREGELALLFGAARTGKSLLAVQIADALARGTPLHGFVMPKGRRKVLYVDLSLSDPQFHARYGQYKFAENLYREVPPDDADLCDWIKRMVEENSFRVVIVDDLSAIKRTHDGIRETLACMRRLKRLRDQLGVSILVLSDAFEPPDRWVSENDLKRSRVLCTVADSVFAMGRKRRPEGGRCIVQTRSRSAEVFWNMQNAPVGEIKWLESGLLGFEFDERFTPEMDENKRRLICEISRLHEVDGKTFREIGQQLGISKSWACELYKKWTPAMENLSEPGAVATGFFPIQNPKSAIQNSDDGVVLSSSDDDWQPPKEAYRGEHTDRYLMSLGMRPVWKEKWEEEQALLSEPGAIATGFSDDSCDFVDEENKTVTTKQHETTPNENDEPFSILSSQFSVPNGLRRRLDAYGREIFVESEDEHTGKPTVWYHFDKKGNKFRCERGMFGITSEYLNASPFL